MLITILGNLGSGKTLFMVVISYFSQKPIVSNFEVKFSNRIIEKFNLNKFVQAKYENCIILLDEAYTYLESRVSANELNRIMSYILFQSRKKNVELYLTTQLLSTIDKRYRELSDVFIVAQRDQNENFCYYITDKQKTVKLCLDYMKMLPFFELYDTNQIILTNNQKILFDTKDESQKDEEIEKQADIIEEFYNNEGLTNITKSMVQLYAMKKGLPNFLVESIFATLKIRKKKKEKV